MRAAIYARTALSSQERIDQQIAACKRFADQQGWSLLDRIFIDDGFSGRDDLKRSALQSLLAAATGSPRPFEIVLVQDVSRLGRYQSLPVPLIEQLRASGISVHAVDSAGIVGFVP